MRFFYFKEELIRGSQREKSNPLRFDKIILNLFGYDNFNNTLPTVIKWDYLCERIAGDIKAFVNELRAIDTSTDHAWRIARWASSRIKFFGCQDVTRKRRVDQGP